MLIHATDDTGCRFLGFLKQEILGSVERRSMPAEAGKVPLHHECHQTERGARNLIISVSGTPRTIGLLSVDEILKSLLNREIRGFGEFRCSFFLAVLFVRNDRGCRNGWIILGSILPLDGWGKKQGEGCANAEH